MAVTAGTVRVWGAGLGVVVLWASAFPAIRVAAPELGVVGLSFVRLAVAAIALLAVAPVFGVRPPAPRDLHLILACGLAGMTAYQLLLNQGELSVPAGTASILVASAPLVSVGLAAVALGERQHAWSAAASPSPASRWCACPGPGSGCPAMYGWSSAQLSSKGSTTP